MKRLIFDDIIGSIDKNVVAGNITVNGGAERDDEIAKLKAEIERLKALQN